MVVSHVEGVLNPEAAMFALIESCPGPRAGSGWSGRLTSFGIHVLVVSAALAATRRGPPASVERLDSHTIYVTLPAPEPGALAPAVAGLVPPPLSIPRVIPPVIPPIDLPGDVPPVNIGVPGSPSDTITLIRGTGSALVAPGASETPRDVRGVDEPPVLLSHPVIRYPEAMRQAGIEGRVLVETVLDSLGRAEPTATHVSLSASEPFDREAMAVVLASRYRAARVNGRAVRVRVVVPVNFSIR
jgi:TonB family protein